MTGNHSPILRTSPRWSTTDFRVIVSRCFVCRHRRLVRRPISFRFVIRLTRPMSAVVSRTGLRTPSRHIRQRNESNCPARRPLQWRRRRTPRSTATSLEWAAAASVCVRLVPENEFGISEQEPKPNRRHDNQADRRDEIPKAILGHRQRYRDRTTPQLNSLVKLDADAAG
jgi:hypothetical protein